MPEQKFIVKIMKIMANDGTPSRQIGREFDTYGEAHAAARALFQVLEDMGATDWFAWAAEKGLGIEKP